MFVGRAPVKISLNARMSAHLNSIKLSVKQDVCDGDKTPVKGENIVKPKILANKTSSTGRFVCGLQRLFFGPNTDVNNWWTSGICFPCVSFASLVFGSNNIMSRKVVLVAEDNPDDALIFEMMFTKAALPQGLHIVEDGQQVIDWLSGAGSYSDRSKYPLPDEVVLDLKMPVKTGFDALEWIRSQSALQKLPVIILSSSDDEKDKKREIGRASCRERV